MFPPLVGSRLYAEVYLARRSPEGQGKSGLPLGIQGFPGGVHAEGQPRAGIELREAGERAGGSAERWRTLETYAFGAAVRGLRDAEFEEGLGLLLKA